MKIVRAKAPLRLGLAGGGTDVSPYCDEYGGCVLNVTIDMYAYCTIEETDDQQVQFHAADINETFSAESGTVLECSGELMLHKGIYNRIIKDYYHGKPLSFKMTTYSDAPPGSGLGSSSTMVVAILKAFTELLWLPLGDYDIARLAYLIERVDLGLKGGKQDQYAATFGGVNFIEFYQDDRVIVNPLRIKNWLKDELESSLILYYTGKSRDSSKIIDEQIRNTVNNEKKSIEAMHAVKANAYRIKEAILTGDTDGFAHLLGQGWHEKKKMSSIITNQHIDEIYDAVMANGAVSGKISGAGGGGFMMFYVDPIKRMQVKETLKKFDGKSYNVHLTEGGAKGWYIR